MRYEKGDVHNEIFAILGKHESLIYQIALRIRKKMNTSSQKKDEIDFNMFSLVMMKSLLFTLDSVFILEYYNQNLEKKEKHP